MPGFPQSSSVMCLGLDKSLVSKVGGFFISSLKFLKKYGMRGKLEELKLIPSNS